MNSMLGVLGGTVEAHQITLQRYNHIIILIACLMPQSGVNSRQGIKPIVPSSSYHAALGTFCTIARNHQH